MRATPAVARFRAPRTGIYMDIYAYHARARANKDRPIDRGGADCDCSCTHYETKQHSILSTAVQRPVGARVRLGGNAKSSSSSSSTSSRCQPSERSCSS